MGEFSPAKQLRDGRRNECRVCRKLYNAGWRAANREQERARAKRVRQEQPAARRASNYRYRASNPEKVLLWDRRQRVRGQASPEYMARRAYYEQVRRARKRSARGSFTLTEWLDLCSRCGFRCLGCRKQVRLTVDHVVPLARGGINDISNIQPLCLSCNSKKGTAVRDYRP